MGSIWTQCCSCWKPQTEVVLQQQYKQAIFYGFQYTPEKSYETFFRAVFEECLLQVTEDTVGEQCTWIVGEFVGWVDDFDTVSKMADSMTRVQDAILTLQFVIPKIPPRGEFFRINMSRE